MQSPIRAITDLLERELTEEEFASIEFELANHPRVLVTVNNVRLSNILPGSPSDRRWLLNWRAQFRRAYKRVKSGEATNTYEAFKR